MANVNHPNLFTSVELTQAVNKLPSLPMRFAPLFASKGVKTTSVAFDVREGRLFLVANQDRKGTPQQVESPKKSTKILQCAHLPLSDSLLPDDIQDVREFGSDEPANAVTELNDRMQALKSPLEVTMEYHRIGALKGVVVDADGTTVLHDMYDTFGISKKALNITFPSTVPVNTNPILAAILEGKRHAEQKAKGMPIARFEAMVGSDFYDALTGHELVREAFELWLAQQSGWGDNDFRKRGFVYGGVTWIEVSDIVEDKPLVAADKAHMYPVTYPGFGAYRTFYAPANWMDTVNTVGIPFYAQMESRKLQRGYDLEVQTNPLCASMYPETLVEFTAK